MVHGLVSADFKSEVRDHRSNPVSYFSRSRPRRSDSEPVRCASRVNRLLVVGPTVPVPVPQSTKPIFEYPIIIYSFLMSWRCQGTCTLSSVSPPCCSSPGASASLMQGGAIVYRPGLLMHSLPRRRCRPEGIRVDCGRLLEWFRRRTPRIWMICVEKLKSYERRH